MAVTLVGSRRSSLEIVWEILSLCAADGVGKTAIMYRSNLSHSQLVRYLSFLFTEGFLARNTSGHFTTTAKGQQTLEQIAVVMKILLSLRQGGGGEPNDNGNS